MGDIVLQVVRSFIRQFARSYILWKQFLGVVVLTAFIVNGMIGYGV